MKKFFAGLMMIVVLTTGVPSAFAQENAHSPIQAKSVALMCMDTGELLYQENEFEHLSPASVTKIMTLLLVLEALDSQQITLQDKVTASKEAVSMGGSQIWLEVGEVMTVEELLKAVVIASANDACTALSEYVGGSVPAFVEKMNQRAAELGLQHTHFENSNGLDDTVTNHYSCAYDLAVIASEVMKHEIIKNYTTVWLDSLRGGKTELNNTNKLVNSYEGITGLKTGTTSNAGFCIAATAQQENMHLVAVVLGSDTSDNRFDTAAYLLDWGFSHYTLIEPTIDKKKITPVRVHRGKQKSVMPQPAKAQSLCIQKGNDDIQYHYTISEEINAPIKKGEKLGEIVLQSEDKTIGTIDLIAPKSVEAVDIKSLLYIILKNI